MVIESQKSPAEIGLKHGFLMVGLYCTGQLLFCHSRTGQQLFQRSRLTGLDLISASQSTKNTGPISLQTLKDPLCLSQFQLGTSLRTTPCKILLNERIPANRAFFCLLVVMYYTPGHKCPGCVVHHYSQFYGKIFWNKVIAQTNLKK